MNSYFSIKLLGISGSSTTQDQQAVVAALELNPPINSNNFASNPIVRPPFILYIKHHKCLTGNCFISLVIVIT